MYDRTEAYRKADAVATRYETYIMQVTSALAPDGSPQNDPAYGGSITGYTDSSGRKAGMYEERIFSDMVVSDREYFLKNHLPLAALGTELTSIKIRKTTLNEGGAVGQRIASMEFPDRDELELVVLSDTVSVRWGAQFYRHESSPGIVMTFIALFESLIEIIPESENR